LAQAEH
jgi:hypothetical protein